VDRDFGPVGDDHLAEPHRDDHPDDATQDQEAVVKPSELVGEWSQRAGQDASITVPKAVTYGAHDLEVMGAALMALVPAFNRWPEDKKRAIGMEMACAFYSLGKISRMFGQYSQGQPAQDDHWFDLTVYANMARTIRETGDWSVTS
jgi:hypothetical protein